jgi:hypothetical protein
MSVTSKTEYTVKLKYEAEGWAGLFWKRKFIGVNGIGGLSFGDWEQELRVGMVNDTTGLNSLDLQITNLDDIDLFIPACCPKGEYALLNFKSWLYSTLFEQVRKSMEIAAKGSDEAKKQRPPWGSPPIIEFTKSNFSQYIVPQVEIVMGRQYNSVPIKFTVTTEEGCDGKCKCTIESDGYKGAIEDLMNNPIKPLEVRPAGELPPLNILPMYEPWFMMNAQFKQSLEDIV